MWYLWCGRKSPLSGRNTKTFERTYVLDESRHGMKNQIHIINSIEEEKVCNMILHEFGLVFRALLISLMGIHRSELQKESIRYVRMEN